MNEDIYGPSVPHFQGKTVQHKIRHLEPVMVRSVPKDILDKYNKVTLFWDIMNTISQHIMFAKVSMIKDRKINNIEDGIKQVHKVYLQHGFKIMRIYDESQWQNTG